MALTKIRPVKTVTLLPAQKLFWHALWYTQDVKFLWYVGGFGSGKTFIGAMSAIYASISTPNNRGVIGRYRLNDCMRTTAQTFFEVLEGVWGIREGFGYTFDRAKGFVRFANGSTVWFIGFEDYNKLKSMELGWAWCDEVDETAEAVFDVLRGRMRLKMPEGREWMKKVWITSNSEGKNWTYRRFVEGRSEGGWHVKDASSYFYVTAPSTQNHHLPKDYLETLAAYDPDKYARYVLGSFDTYEGQIYPMYRNDIHVFDRYPTPDGQPDPNWSVGYGFDYGQTNPTAVVKVYTDYDGNAYVDDEVYLPRAPDIRENALKILAMAGDERITCMADPSSVALKRGRASADNPYELLTVGDTYQELGVTLLPANNDVDAGITEIKQRLSPNPNRMNPFTGKMGSPSLFVHSRCANVRSEFNAYRWAKRSSAAEARGLNQPEQPEKKDDHAMDALRYWAMSCPSAARAPVRKKGGRIEYTRDEDLKRCWAAANSRDSLEKREDMLQSDS